MPSTFQCVTKHNYWDSLGCFVFSSQRGYCQKKLVSLTLHLFKEKHPCPHAFKPDWRVDWPSNRCSASFPPVSLFAIFRFMHSALQGTTALQTRCNTDLRSAGIDFLGNSFLKVWRKTLFLPHWLKNCACEGLAWSPLLPNTCFVVLLCECFVCLGTDLSSYCSNLIGLLVIYSPPFFEYPLLRFPNE